MSITLKNHINNMLEIKKTNEELTDRIKRFSLLIAALSLPFKDKFGNILQLWSVPECSVVATVQFFDGKYSIIPSSHIYNGLDPSMDNLTLHNCLLKSADKVWDLVLRRNGTLFIWPHLIAGGWKHVIPRSGGDLTSFTRLAQKMTQSEMCGWFYANNFRCQSTNKIMIDVYVDQTHVGLFHPIRDHDAIRSIIMSQTGSKVSVTLKVDAYHPSEGDFAGRGLVFSHPKDRSHATFNIDCTMVEGGSREKIGGYHIDVKSDHMLVKGKVSTKETYEANRHARAQSKTIPFDILPTIDSLRLAPHQDPAKQRFRMLLDQASLIDSYNSLHPENPILSRTYQHGEIGGVACSASYIENLFQDAKDLLVDRHYFALPTFDDGSLPFTDSELKQIIRELTIGIYAHGQVPFFSLHFQELGSDLYPIIHPVYQNTLVGKVIGLLDYMMKGYLNGGFYQQEFIDSWYKHPDWRARERSALEQMIDFEAYCDEFMSKDDKPYIPLSAKLPNINADDDAPEILKSFSSFRNSFRIIAKQSSIEKYDDLFLINSDFDVFYDISPTPEYKIELEAYLRRKGSYPDYYVQMEKFYKEAAFDIKHHMINMPLCKKFFKMLAVISFFGSYLSTLKKHRKELVLPVCEKIKLQPIPPLLPHLPIKTKVEFDLTLNLYKCFASLYFSKKLEMEEFSKVFILDLELKKNTEKKDLLKDILISQMGEVVKDFFWNKAGVLGQRSLKNKTALNEIAIKTAIDLFDEYENFLSAQFEAFHENSVKLEQIKVQIARFIEFFLNILDRQNEIPCIHANKIVNLLVHEIKNDKLEKVEHLVGGCSIKLEKLKIQNSDRAKELLQVHHSVISVLETEKYICLGDSKGMKYGVFGLEIRDTPPALEDNFIWTESLLATNLSPNIILFHELKKCISSNNQDKFTELLRIAPLEIKVLTDCYERTLLHYAVSLNIPFFVNGLVDYGFSLSAKDQAGLCPIHFAAAQGNLEILNKLYCVGDENLKGNNGETPLTLAILSQNILSSDFFIKKGAAITITIGGYTDIHAAAYVNNKTILKLIFNHSEFSNFVNHKSLEGGTALMIASESADLEIIQTMVEKGADVTICSSSGTSCHEIAIKKDDVDLAMYFLSKSLPTYKALKLCAEKGSLQLTEVYKNLLYDLRDPSNDTVIHKSLEAGNIQVALKLIQDCSELKLLEQTNIEMKSVMERACYFGEITIIQALHDKGLRLLVKEALLLINLPYEPKIKEWIVLANFSKDEIKNLFMQAAKIGNFKVCLEVLIPLKPEIIKETTEEGWSFIHFLAKFDNLILFKKFTDGLDDFDLKTVGSERITLAGIAAKYASRKVLSYLLMKPISYTEAYKEYHLLIMAIQGGVEDLIIDIFYDKEMNKKGLKAIHFAAGSGNLGALKKMLELGIDINLPDFEGLKPIDYAILHQRDEIVLYLASEKKCVVSKDTLILAAKISMKLVEILYRSQDLTSIKALALAEGVRNDDVKLINTLNLIVYKPVKIKERVLTFMKALVANKIAEFSALIQFIPYEFLINQTVFSQLRDFKKTDQVERLILERFERESVNFNSSTLSGRTLFAEAILVESYALVNYMIDHGARIAYKDSSFLNPLSYACLVSNLDIFKLLIAKGANLFDKVTAEHISIVDFAVLSEFIIGVEYLLSNSIHVDRISINKTNLIHLLVKKDRISSLRFMVSRGITPFEEIGDQVDFREYAAQIGSLQVLKFLIEMQGYSLTQKEGNKIMNYAIANNQIHVVHWLLTQGVEPLEQEEGLDSLAVASGGNLGTTCLNLFKDYKIIESPEALKKALISAIHSDKVEICKQLFKHGLGINDDLFEGVNSLQLAVRMGALGVLNYLLSVAANLDVLDSDSKTIFELAAESDKTEVLKVICDFSQIDLNKQYASGQTLLHLAAKSNKINNILYLLSEDAIVDIIDDLGCTALHRACEVGSKDIIDVLICFGANLEVISVGGKKPLEMLPAAAVSIGAIVRSYPSKISGDTSLHLAVKYDCKEAASLLLKILSQEMLAVKNSEYKTAREILDELEGRKDLKLLFEITGL